MENGVWLPGRAPVRGDSTPGSSKRRKMAFLTLLLARTAFQNGTIPQLPYVTGTAQSKLVFRMYTFKYMIELCVCSGGGWGVSRHFIL